MNFIYTVDPNSSEPIMLIDDVIGVDEVTGKGISAEQFCKELLTLDTMNKSKINVWINSPGGSVLDGQQIFNTILKTKTKVDTHNVGMAASIAAPIFLAGRNRYMMDNAVLMVHPVAGGDDESRKVFENCVNTMISSRSYLTENVVKGMMDATTWLSAVDCNNMGLCTMENSSEMNKPRSKPDLSNIATAHSYYKQFTNNILKTNKMDYKQINNKLELNEDASLTATMRAIEELQNKANLASEIENKFKALENSYKTLENKVKEAEDAEKAAKLLAVETEAKTEITNAVKVGKIQNDATIIEMWTNNYKSNPVATKELLNSIQLSKQAPKLPETKGEGNTNEAALTMVAAMEMATLQNKFLTNK